MIKWLFIALVVFDIYRGFYPAEKYSLLIMPSGVKYVSLPLYSSLADAEQVASLIRSSLSNTKGLTVDVVKSTSTYFEKQDAAKNPTQLLTFGG